MVGTPLAIRGFDFDVHHDGVFVYNPLRYDNGNVLPIYVGKMDFDELICFLEKETGSPLNGLYYTLPGRTVENGLLMLENNDNVNVMYDIGFCYGKIDIYMDRFNENLSEYLLELNDGDVINNEEPAVEPIEFMNLNVEGENEDLIDSVIDEPFVDKPIKIGEVKARDKPVEIVESKLDDKPGETEEVKVDNNASDKGKAKVDDTAVVDSDSENEYDSDYVGGESDTESDTASIDHLSEGEEELKELRIMKANAKKEPKPLPQPKLGVPKRSKNSQSNPMMDAIGEHEEFMEELLKKLKGNEAVSDPFKAVVNVEKLPIHDEKTNWRLKKPIVSERYANAKQFKDCLTYYALANGFSLWYHRSCEKEVIAKCGQRPPKLKNPKEGKQRKYNRYPSVARGEGPKCPWRCYGRKMKTEDSFQVISLVDVHTCVRNFRFGSLINYNWIGRQFGDKIRANPDIRLVDIADLVMKKYKCLVTPNQCSKAKSWALNEYEKSIEEHYGLLRSYADELLTSNPGSTVQLGVTRNPDEKVYFDRFYVCLNGLKEGWKNGCRRIIALDGCFLKKPNQGELLTAIGRDGNNHIFPVAWAVVSVENKQNWTWFIELLAADLEVHGGVGLTLMSDQHKGLIEAVKDIMPYAEHKQCARHIYENFRKKFSGVEFRSLFWAASKSSYPVLFDTIMGRIRDANPNAYKYLSEKNPKSWSRAFFETNRGCEAVENGFSECFNSVIVLFRHKPIITMLEAIRVIVMERMNVMRTLAEDWVGDIAPNIVKRLEWNKDQHSYWRAHFAGGFEFKVRQKSEAFKVDEQKRTCSCRMWQLSGLPCPHACAAIFKLAKSPEDYIPAWFRKEMYMRAYTTYLRAVGGMTTWVPNKLNIPLPPPIRKMPGRPKKKRRRAAHEGGTGVRISKAGAVMTCKICFQVGHNKRSCKNNQKKKPVKVSNPVGRPRKDGRPSGAGLSGQTVGGGTQVVGGGSQSVDSGAQSIAGSAQSVAGASKKHGSTYGLKGGPRNIPKWSTATQNVSSANATQNVSTTTSQNMTTASAQTCGSTVSPSKRMKMLPKRNSSQRIINKKLSKQISGPGSSSVNVMDIE